MSVASGVKAIMKRKGLKQRHVAQKANFTEHQFCDMMNGRKLILADYLPRIALALGVRVEDIFEAGDQSS